jgi:hypothetical protein
LVRLFRTSGAGLQIVGYHWLMERPALAEPGPLSKSQVETRSDKRRQIGSGLLQLSRRNRLSAVGYIP